MQKRIRTVWILMCMSVMGLATGSWALRAGLLGADLDVGIVSGYLTVQGISDLTYVDTRDVTPTLAELQAYDAVLVWTNGDPLDPVALGDRLADYVDGGGRVVLATFGFGPGGQVKGRIMTPAYSPFTWNGSNYADSSLGTYNGSSPLMSGVASLTGHYRDNMTLNAGAQLVASWADGQPLLATNHFAEVLGINLYPGENSHLGLGGDYARLFANALGYVVPTYLAVYVTLLDYSGDPTYYNVKVELLQAGIVVYSAMAQGAPTRTVVNFPSVTPGTYDVRASSCTWLAQTYTLLLPSGPIGVGFTLDNGDLNGDGSVGLRDLGIMKKNWGKHS
jgi:hypothetical protein